jgi:hypothetical protein
MKHYNACQLWKHQGVLTDYGITGGHAPLTNYDVREYAALWIAEDGRPFVILSDHYVSGII